MCSMIYVEDYSLYCFFLLLNDVLLFQSINNNLINYFPIDEHLVFHFFNYKQKSTQ